MNTTIIHRPHGSLLMFVIGTSRDINQRWHQAWDHKLLWVDIFEELFKPWVIDTDEVVSLLFISTNGYNFRCPVNVLKLLEKKLSFKLREMKVKSYY